MSLRAIFSACRNSVTHLFHTHFHVRRHFVRLPPLLSSVARQQNLTEYWREGSTSTAISTTFASDVVGKHNKIGGINFGAALVIVIFLQISKLDGNFLTHNISVVALEDDKDGKSVCIRKYLQICVSVWVPCHLIANIERAIIKKIVELNQLKACLLQGNIGYYRKE